MIVKRVRTHLTHLKPEPTQTLCENRWVGFKSLKNPPKPGQAGFHFLHNMPNLTREHR